MFAALKRVLVGRPLASHEEAHQRLRKRVALPIFASDAMSSTAYATDEIVGVLLVQAGIGVAAFDSLVPISIVVVVLLAIVVLSYRQTIFAYPSGGGSYIVSRENLGEMPSLVAGASLLVDYILTVAVSIAGAVLAIRSATGLSTTWAVPMCLGLIFFMTVANLRGLQESGALFAPPTYLYVVMLVLLIVVGLYRVFVQDIGPIPDELLSEEGRELAEMSQALTLLMLLRAFSSGAVALSGVEAVSNGVPAFRRPESRNASLTLLMMAVILGICFFGISLLASHLQPFRGHEDPTSIALMAEYVYGGKGVLFWITQLATFAILTLAANTAYADFPGLSSIIARDGYLPRQLVTRGDRLVFSNGIVFLAVMAGGADHRLQRQHLRPDPALRGGRVHRLHAVPVGHGRPPPPAQGAPLAGQPGHQRRGGGDHRGRGPGRGGVEVHRGRLGPRRRHPALRAAVQGHQPPLQPARRASCSIEPGDVQRRPMRHTMVVLVGNIHQGVVAALQYAQSLRPDHLIAVHVASSEEEQERMQVLWAAVRLRRAPRDGLLALPGHQRLDHALHRRARRALGQRPDHGDHPRVRGPEVVGAHPPQPVGAVPQGSTAVPAQRGRAVPALPRELIPDFRSAFGCAGRRPIPHRPSPRGGIVPIPPRSAGAIHTPRPP